MNPDSSPLSSSLKREQEDRRERAASVPVLDVLGNRCGCNHWTKPKCPERGCPWQGKRPADGVPMASDKCRECDGAGEFESALHCEQCHVCGGTGKADVPKVDERFSGNTEGLGQVNKEGISSGVHTPGNSNRGKGDDRG